MNRSSYFISARSASADLLASELILALSDQYQRLDAYGILGEWSGRTRANKIGDLTKCQQLFLHDEEQLDPAGLLLRTQLLQQIAETPFNVAILVGYSYFHHELAAVFKKLGVPVVLYEMTPNGALASLDFSSVKDRVHVALGVTPQGSEFINKSGIPYFYIGSPHKDRVDRVKVGAAALGLRPDVPLITLFPGGRMEGVEASFPTFQGLAERLAQEPQVQVVLSLVEGLVKNEMTTYRGKTVAQITQELAKGKNPIKVTVGMHLELLSLSQLAICGTGAITVECGLFSVPALSLYPPDAISSSLVPMHSLLNQTSERHLIAEASTATPIDKLVKEARELLVDGTRRQETLKGLQEFKRDLQGFAAENAAAYIGREVGRWQQSKKPKDSKTA